MFMWGLDFEYDSERNAAVLVVGGRDGIEEEDVVGFECGMLQHNRIPGMLEVGVVKHNRKVFLRYAVGERKRVADLMRTERLAAGQIIAFLAETARIMHAAEPYLLRVDRWVLDDRWMYADPATFAPALVYVPIVRGRDARVPVGSRFRELAVKWFSSARAFDAPGVQEALELLLCETATLQEISRRLARIGEEASASTGQTAEPSLRTRPPNVAQRIKDGLHFFGMSRLFRGIGRKASVPVLFWLLAAAGWIAYMRMQVEAFRLIGAGFALLGVATTYARIMPRMRERETPESDAALTADPDLYYRDLPERTCLLEQPPDRTELLAPEAEAHAGWTLLSGEGEERVCYPLNGRKTVIGRSGEFADIVVEAAGLSRSHLEIGLEEGERLSIRDLGSMNGSFLNGDKLTAYKAYWPESGDVVLLAGWQARFEKAGRLDRAEPRPAESGESAKAIAPGSSSGERKHPAPAPEPTVAE